MAREAFQLQGLGKSFSEAVAHKGTRQRQGEQSSLPDDLWRPRRGLIGVGSGSVRVTIRVSSL